MSVVYERQSKNRLQVASSMLTQDVLGDLTETRNQMLEAFGGEPMPELLPENSSTILNYFLERGWSIPQGVVIHPETDRFDLLAILESSRFPVESDITTFTGANGMPMSAGVSPQHDLVLFHDMRDTYRQMLLHFVESYSGTISEDNLERATELKLADFITHEYAHLAGKLAVSEIVVAKSDKGYRIEDDITAGFISIHDAIGSPTLHEKSGRYNGPAIDEGWAALNGSRVVTAMPSEFEGEMRLKDRYRIPAIASNEEYDSVEICTIGLSSGLAGLAIERLDRKFPGIISLMDAAASGEISASDSVADIYSRVPRKYRKLLREPRFEAWQKLNRLLVGKK